MQRLCWAGENNCELEDNGTLSVAWRMGWGSGRNQSVVEQASARELTFLVELPPRYKSFFSNVGAVVFAPQARARLTDATFWPDVFVPAPVPWGKLLESAACHVLVVVALLAWGRIAPRPAVMVNAVAFHRSDVVTYSASDYLPPLNTGGTRRHSGRKGDPVKAAQEIISVPAEADNLRQTIVAAPSVKISHDVPLPNIVTLNHAPLPAPPVAADLKLPRLSTPVVAPPPEILQTARRQLPGLDQPAIAPAPEISAELRAPSGPQPAVVEPPPTVAAVQIRAPGEINIGPADVIAPAPQLPVAAQRTLGGSGAALSQAILPEAVPPPVAIANSAGGSSGARLIALNVEPVAALGPIAPPGGNRRGEFAASPAGRVGGSGAPDIRDSASRATLGTGRGNGGAGAANAHDVPPGLFVGAPPQRTDHFGNGGPGGNGFGTADAKNLIADATRPQISSRPHQSPAELPGDRVSEVERQVFRDRKLYSMMLNLPNLNSAGGSWVMHFAELQERNASGELIGPVPTQAVDPAYPTELMRENVQGTVTLYAVIHSDGHVSDVRVLQGVDDRLDAYATQALSRWRFRPATKNGSAVPLEAVVSIPFRSPHREF